MKILTSIWIVCITVMIGVGLRVYDVEPLKILRLKTFDYYQQIQPRTITSNHFVIVEITEEDLTKYGQWPWSRNFVAEIHQRIINQKANTVQYNILFSEPDRLNASSFVETQNLPTELKDKLLLIPDNDQTLAQFFNVGDAVLMYSVKNSATDGKIKKPNIMYKGADPKGWLFNFLGVVNNLPIFLDSAKGVGVNIMIPSIDGTVRSQPLLVNTDQGVVPAQILETLRVVMNGRAYKVVTAQDGVREIYLNRQFVIRPNSNAMININFADPNTIPTISVNELMTNDIDLTNKIVVVGLNAAGLSTLKDTPLGLMTDMQISVQAMDTIATKTDLQRDNNLNLYEIIGTTILLLIFLIIVPEPSNFLYCWEVSCPANLNFSVNAFNKGSYKRWLKPVIILPLFCLKINSNAIAKTAPIVRLIKVAVTPDDRYLFNTIITNNEGARAQIPMIKLLTNSMAAV